MTRNVRILDRQFYPAGTLVIEQGAVGNRAFIVESGSVVVFVKDARGNEVILTELGPGSLVGEMAAIAAGQRSASARTSENSILISVSSQDLHASMRASENLYRRLMSMVVDRIRDTNMKLLQKEQELVDVEKAFRMNVDTVAAHLAAKQDKLHKEVLPFLSQMKDYKFNPAEFEKDI